MKLLRLPLTSESFLELKGKFGGPTTPRGQKRAADREITRDKDGLEKRQKPQVKYMINFIL